MDEAKMTSVEVDLALNMLEEALERDDIERAKEYLEWLKKKTHEMIEEEAKCIKIMVR